MEAHLCLPTRHFPAMRHHKTVLVHSSVRLPALQAKVGPPPGAARVAAVGAGVVLACALGTMYWKRARALQLPMHCSNQKSYGENGGAGGQPGFPIKKLHDLLSEICIRKLDRKPAQLIELIHQCLAQKDLNPDLMTSLLEGKFPKISGKHEYNLGIVLILALISETKYAKAKEICNQLIIPMPSDSEAIPKDARRDLLLAIINMMVAMESMLQFPDKTSTHDLKQQLDQVKKAWENGAAGDHPASGIVPIEKLHDLLSEICIRKLDPKPDQLIEFIHQCLAQKDLNPDLMRSLLEGKFPKNSGEHEHLGIVLILALISEKKYVRAEEFCKQLPVQSAIDPTLDLLLAIINIMMAMESMLQFPDNKTSTQLDLKQQLEQVEKAWENYKEKADFLAKRPI